MNVMNFYIDRQFSFLIVILCFLSDLLISNSYPFYKRDLPASRVPLWCEGLNYSIFTEATGHQLCGKNKFLRNAREYPNKFGKDFSKANGNWSAICWEDSDGDGMTNGEELGDPECSWQLDEQKRVALSHPGYSEIKTESNGYILNSTYYDEVCEDIIDISLDCISEP